MDSVCKVIGCERPVYVVSHGLCSLHYNRLLTYGTVEPDLQRIVGDDERRFLSKVSKSDGCWMWTGGSRTAQGYPLFSVNRRNVMAHRWAYEQYVGEISDGHQIDHLCRVIDCVRPDHLESVTQAENRRRQAIANRKDRRCEVAGCDLPYRCSGMCRKHYAAEIYRQGKGSRSRSS